MVGYAVVMSTLRFASYATIFLAAAWSAMIALSSVMGRSAAPGFVVPVIMPSIHGDRDLYVIEVNRGLLAIVTRNRVWKSSPSLSPDGEQVVYASLLGDRVELFIAELFTGRVRVITDDLAAQSEPAWSPDGQWIAFASSSRDNTDIYLMRASGGPAQRLTEYIGVDISPVWSPDGRRLVFVSNRNTAAADLYVLDIDCPAPPDPCRVAERTLARYPRFDLLPKWSPDGRTIAFLSDRTGAFDIYLIETACLDRSEGCDGNARRHRTQPMMNVLKLFWSPDSQRIMFITSLPPNPLPEIYAIEVGCDQLPGGCQPAQVTRLNRSLTAWRLRSAGR
jgi:Tol biopolymer transport system component